MNTGVITNPAGNTNTIAQNAEILGQYISHVKEKTGAEMVDLLVHRMGGIISRSYIDRLLQDRDVAQLIMLGSPMGGSRVMASIGSASRVGASPVVFLGRRAPTLNTFW